jgi:uncharacterized protein (DUF1697 family)
MAVNGYVALLRGINVGGNNLISMPKLREAFEKEGHVDVRTYIASGNVLFKSDRPGDVLEGELEAMIEREFGLNVLVLIRSRAQMRNIVSKAPPGFGQRPDVYHSDVIFLKKPLTAAKVMKVIELREGVDQAWPGNGVFYFARLSERRAQSKLSKFASTAEYKLASIRSWTTTTKLAELLEAL